MPTPRRALILLIVLLGSAAGEDLAPGAHKGRPSVGAPDRTYDLWIPADYATNPAPCPVLFLSMPGGNPGTCGMTKWADRNHAVIVSINSSRNGPGDNNVAAQEAVLASIGSLRLSACLRFAMGMSGGAQASWLFASRHPDAFAGLVMQGQAGFDDTLPAHISVAYIRGDKEPNNPYIESAIARLKAARCQVRDLVKPGGHIGGSAQECATMLDWMLGIARLTHPRLPPAERAAALADYERRIGAIAELPDAAARLAEAESLIVIPGMEGGALGRKLVPVWIAARLEVLKAEPDIPKRHLALSELAEDPRLRGAPQARDLAAELKELRKVSPGKEEWQAYQALRATEALEAKAGSAKAKRVEVARAYASISGRFPETIAGKRALAAAKRLEAELSGK